MNQPKRSSAQLIKAHPNCEKLWQLARPSLARALIDPTTDSALQELSTSLPLQGDIALEIQLGAGINRVDVNQRFTVEELTQQCFRSKAFCGKQSMLNDLGHAWAGMSKAVIDATRSIWLEYDALPCGRFTTEHPAVYIELKTGANLSSVQWQEALGRLLSRQEALEILKNQWCLDPTEARQVAIAGVMSSRSPVEVKTNVHIKAQEIQAYAGKHAPKTLMERLDRFLAQHPPSSILCDRVLTGSKSPRVGINYSWFKANDANANPQFLELLVDEGLCSPEKRDALLKFPYRASPDNADIQWPDTWIADSLRHPVNQFSVMRGFLHMFKLVFSRNAPPSAKVYLGFAHVFETL